MIPLTYWNYGFYSQMHISLHDYMATCIPAYRHAYMHTHMPVAISQQAVVFSQTQASMAGLDFNALILGVDIALDSWMADNDNVITRLDKHVLCSVKAVSCLSGFRLGFDGLFFCTIVLNRRSKSPQHSLAECVRTCSCQRDRIEGRVLQFIPIRYDPRHLAVYLARRREAQGQHDESCVMLCAALCSVPGVQPGRLGSALAAWAPPWLPGLPVPKGAGQERAWPDAVGGHGTSGAPAACRRLVVTSKENSLTTTEQGCCTRPLPSIL